MSDNKGHVLVSTGNRKARQTTGKCFSFGDECE